MHEYSDNQIRNDEQFATELRGRLGYLMRIRGISPAELARSAGLPNANLFYNFFSGRSKSLHLFTIRQVCKVLGVSMGELLDDNCWHGRLRIRSSGHVQKEHRKADVTGEVKECKATATT